MTTGTVSSANSTSLYSNTTSFTTGLVNSSVYSVNGGVGVTVNPTTGNVVVNIGQDVATTATPTFAGATLGNITIGVATDNTITTTTGALYLNSAVTSGTQLYIGNNADVLQTGFSSPTNAALYTDNVVNGTLFNNIYNTVNNSVIYPLRIAATAGTAVTPTVGYGVGMLAEGTLTNGSFGSLGKLNWESGSVSPGDNDTSFNVYTYGNNIEKKVAEINGNGAYFDKQVHLFGVTSGYVELFAGFTPANQTYTLPQAYPAASGYVLASTTGGAMSWVSASSLGNVTSITGTANQVIASSPTGAVTLSLPQDIATTSSVAFGQVTVDGISTYNTQTTTTTSTATVPISGTTRASQKSVIRIIDNVTGNIQMLEALAFYKGTTAYLTTYAEMYTSVAALATFTASISAGTISILATPASTNSTTFTVARISLD